MLGVGDEERKTWEKERNLGNLARFPRNLGNLGGSGHVTLDCLWGCP